MRTPLRVAGVAILMLTVPGLSAAQDTGQARLAALKRLSEQLEGGSVVGRFVERTQGAFLFVPEARDLPALPVLNASEIAPTSVGPRLEVQAIQDPDSAGIRVKGYSLAVRASSSADSGMMMTRATEASPVERALATFQGQISQALQPEPFQLQQATTQLQRAERTLQQQDLEQATEAMEQAGQRIEQAMQGAPEQRRLHLAPLQESLQQAQHALQLEDQEGALQALEQAQNVELLPPAPSPQAQMRLAQILGAENMPPEVDPMIAQAAHEAEQELDAAYQDAVTRGDEEQRGAAVRGIADVRQQLKAIYGSYDNYPPWSYQQIFFNSQAVVALAEPGQDHQALCSGVLVAPDLVLTAGHCFRRHHPEDLQVWFGFVEQPGGVLPAPLGFDIAALVAPPEERHADFLARAADERFDAEVPDFAILRIAANDGSSLPTDVTPQCLRSGHISRDRPIYAVGYPKGTREMVHDNGRVYLPFRVRAREFQALRKEIEIDFAELADEDRVRLVNEFVSSYAPKGEGTSALFELHDVRYGGQPKIGIVADTFQGNSGSPVFDRNNHCITGILIGGAPDLGQRLGATWQFHETVLPMPAILANLRQRAETAMLLDDGALDIR